MLLLLLCMLLLQLEALSGILLRSSDSAAATATWPSPLGQAAACCQYERSKGASLLLLAQLFGLCRLRRGLTWWHLQDSYGFEFRCMPAQPKGKDLFFDP